jgi:hypothetical protein
VVAAAGTVVVLLAIFFLLSSDEAAGGDETVRASRQPTARTTAPEMTATVPTPPREGDEESGARLATATSRDAGEAVDGGSFDEFLETIGKQAVAQFLADNAAAAEKHVDRYCSETKDLVSRKELADPPRNRDAAVYMAGRADWEGGKIGMLHLPASITQRMSNPPNAWRKAGPELYAGLDFSWMTEVMQFDHWSLYGAGPLRDEKETNFYEANIPNYISLQHWAKLRLLKGVHEGNLAQASVEVRHLAGLIASSGTLIGEMIRIAIYGIERKTWEDLGQPMPEALPSADEAWRLRHSAFAGMYLLYPGVPRAVKEKALKCIPMRCAALVEAIGAAASMKQIVPGMQQEIDWLRAQSPCDAETATRAANSPPATREILQQNYMSDLSLMNSLNSLTDGGI